VTGVHFQFMSGTAFAYSCLHETPKHANCNKFYENG
jgi:hypothetical protein